MLNAEAVKELNRILPELPIEREFIISDYVNDIEVAKRIFLYLGTEKFIETDGNWLRSGFKKTPTAKWTNKGMQLRLSGSYDAYSNNESVRIANEQDRIENQQINLLWLTGILSFGTLALAGSEFVKIYYEHREQLGTYVWILICSAILVFLLTKLRRS